MATPETVLAPAGYLTAAISSLPLALRAILSAMCVVLGVFLFSSSLYGLRWLAHLGKVRGDDASRPWIAGGLTGILGGALGTAYLALLLALAILTRQDDPSLGGAALVVILVASALVGSVLGGRWKWVSKLLISFIGGLSFTALLVVSFHVQKQIARLIFLAIFLPLALIACSLFSIPRLHFQRASTRACLFLCSVTGAWLFAVGIDVFVKVGLMDAFSLFTSDRGLVVKGLKMEETVISWNISACKGLLAGSWLLTIIGTAFQFWRYSILGDDPEEQWNSYLGTIISEEKVGQTPLLDHGRSGVFSTRPGLLSRMFAANPTSNKKARQPAMYKGDMEAIPTTDADTGEYENSPFADVQLPRFPNQTSFTGASRPPARYDATYAGLGFSGLYDDVDEKDYLPEKGFADERPVYDPVQYQRQALPRFESNPSFRSVPPYESPLPTPMIGAERTPSLSGSTIFGNNSVDGAAEKEMYNGTVRRAGEKELAGASPNLSMGSEGPLQAVFGVKVAPKAVATAPILPKFATRDTSTSLPSTTAFATRRASPILTSGLASPKPRIISPSSSPVLPVTSENPYEQITVAATPSLLNAIKRVSAAQQQAKDWRLKHAAASSQNGLGIGVPQRDHEVLQAAAKRRQSSQAEWWSEVERKARSASGGST